MLTRIKVVYSLTLFLLTAMSAHAQDKIFSIPDSALLFSSAGLKVVMPNTSEAIRIPLSPDVKRGPGGYPSLSADGNLVSTAFPVANDSNKRWGVRVAVAVYSRLEKQWRTYGDFSQVHTTAISADGSRLAFIAETNGTESRELLLLDVTSGQITGLSKKIAVSMSWSPDGKRLAIDIPPVKAAKIAICDVDSGTLREVCEGNLPAWSPTGEWIAYTDPSDQEVRLVHPDGKGDRVLKDLRMMGVHRTFGLMPVWSPDGTRLLMNVYKGYDMNYMDVMMLDVKTGKMTEKSHNGHPVFGWARLRE